MKKPEIGISGCLLGENIRHNAGNTRDRWVTDVLAKEVNLKSFCPEVSMGLGVPREPLRIVENDTGELNLVERDTGVDWTDVGEETYSKILASHDIRNLSGFILMRKSPTCGIENVKIYKPGRDLFFKKGQGLFTEALCQKFPNLPKIDSGRMNNLEERELFFRKVYAYQKFKNSISNLKELMNFHAEYKYIMMEHSPEKLKSLGNLIAKGKGYDFEIIKSLYEDHFFQALEAKPKIGHKLNVLQHMAGYFKNELSKQEKAEITRIFNEYHQGKTPFLSPLNLIQFLANKYQVKYLLGQAYFSAFPIAIR